MEAVTVSSDLSLSALVLGLAAGKPTGRLMSIQVFTGSSSGTYTTPANISAIWVRMCGGGGGGGGAAQAASQSAAGGGGGAGSYLEKYITSPSATYAYTVGAGGAGGTAGNNAGSNGTASTFGTSLLTAGRGNGGAGCPASASIQAVTGGSAVLSTGGDINGMGAAGFPGYTLSITLAISGQGGASVWGQGGGARIAEAAGLPSSATGLIGGGGSGGVCTGTTARAGGPGSDGAIIVFEFT
jgi:hypothetical protein